MFFKFFARSSANSVLVVGIYMYFWTEFIIWVPTRVKRPKLRQSTALIVKGGLYNSSSGSSWHKDKNRREKKLLFFLITKSGDMKIVV